MSNRNTIGILLLLLTSSAFAQLSFDIASVKLSARHVGPDYNNQITFTPEGLTARNVTITCLISEAYEVQKRMVAGPNWLGENEYDIEARAGHPVTPEQLRQMTRNVLTQRFKLTQHRESRTLRVYELTTDKSGPKVHPVNAAETPKPNVGGLRFHGDMHHFADFLAVQFSIPATNDPTQPATAGGPTIPVLDKTGLSGTYDFPVDIKPELATDMLTQWQRVLPEALGLKLQSRRSEVAVIVVDSASKIPTAN